MAGRPFVPCVGPSYSLPDRKSAVQRAVNLAMRAVEGPGEPNAVVLVSADGLESVVDLGATIRGGHMTSDGREFVVAGSTLYEIVDGAGVSRGTLLTPGGDVDLCAGETQLVVVDGQFGYVLTLASNAFVQITSPGWRGAVSVGIIDGTFIFVPPDNQEQFYISSIDDATTMNALDFSSADAVPGAVVRLKVLKQEAYFFKPLSTEVWVYDGESDFPLVRYNSTPIAVGLVGLNAVVEAADTFVFVGTTSRGSGVVYVMSGHQPVRISTEAVERDLQASGVDLSTCRLWVQQKAGAEYVGVTASGMATTWVWDAAMKQWHERGELVDGEWAPLRVQQVLPVGTEHHALAGSVVYRMADDVYALGADPLVRSRVWPHFPNASHEPITIRGLELGCTTGHGGSVMLRVSKDGGFTFGPWMTRSLGSVGRWMQRIRWLLLGSGRDPVFEIRVSDAVPLTITDAAVDA